MKTLTLAVRRLLALGWRADRRRLLTAMVLMFIGYLSTPLVALLLRDFTNEALAGEATATLRIGFAIGVLLVFELMMNHFAHLSYFELGELEEIALHEEILDVSNGTLAIAHFDEPDFADTISLVREDLVRTRQALEAVLQLGGLGLQTLLTTVILGMLDPWLILLPLAAVPPVLISNRAQRLIERAKEDSAPAGQLSRHLLELATSSHSMKELRLFHAETRVLELQEQAWSTATEQRWRAHRRAALLRAAGQLLFAVSYGAAIFLVVRNVVNGGSSVGDVVLVVALAVQVSVQVAAALALLANLQSAGRTFERLEELRQRSNAHEIRPAATVHPVPRKLIHGLVLEDVTFQYPGTERAILSKINLTIPAGSSLAVVGENGAGKSTLVKLLCGLYRPTSGRILVDGVDLWSLPTEEWRSRIAMLFQDFARLQLTLRENVGIGHLPDLSDDAAVTRALDLANGQRILSKVPGGLDGLLGHQYGDGVDLSGGQWQILGLARAVMRNHPLLLALDEPASALDAAAEHALFERFVASAESAGSRDGAVTLFVSHRFSTVRMADQIVVLDGGVVLEHGDHPILMAKGGLYAELFQLQAQVYA